MMTYKLLNVFSRLNLLSFTTVILTIIFTIIFTYYLQNNL
jgi:hypothetical protein